MLKCYRQPPPRAASPPLSALPRRSSSCSTSTPAPSLVATSNAPPVSSNSTMLLGAVIVASSFGLVMYARRSQALLKRMEGKTTMRTSGTDLTCKDFFTTKTVTCRGAQARKRRASQANPASCSPLTANKEMRAPPVRDGPKTKVEHDKTRKRMEDDEF